MLLLISGLPVSGKSTLARAYTARYGGTPINSDLIRTELGLRGHYLPNDKKRVYAAMLEKVKAVLSRGDTAVVDSTFYLETIRRPFEEVARACGVPVYRAEVHAQEATIRQRLQTPRPDSEADFAVYEKIRDQYEPWTEPHLELWSDSESLDTLIARLHEYIVSNHDC
jgi:predicted kinase